MFLFVVVLFCLFICLIGIDILTFYFYFILFYFSVLCFVPLSYFYYFFRGGTIRVRGRYGGTKRCVRLGYQMQNFQRIN